MAVKKRGTLPVTANSHCPQSGVDAWVTMYNIVWYKSVINSKISPRTLHVLLLPHSEILAAPGDAAVWKEQP